MSYTDTYNKYDAIEDIIDNYIETHNVGTLLIYHAYSVIADNKYKFIFSTTKNEERMFYKLIDAILNEIASIYQIPNIQIKTVVNSNKLIQAEVTIMINK